MGPADNDGFVYPRGRNPIRAAGPFALREEATMQVGIDVPIPESGYDPAGEIHAATWLKDTLEGVRRTYLELFLPDSPDPSL